MREVFLPGSLEDLWRLWSEKTRASVYAGGTDLLVRMYHGLADPQALICLDRIKELKGVGEQGGRVRIGSCVTYGELITEPLVRNCLPALHKAIRQIGSPPVRTMGTIGGNICTASPAGDTLPPLYAMEAEVELVSRTGLRRAPIREFIVGPGRTCLGGSEILSAVWVKKPEGFNLHHFEKVGLRSALACSVVSLAALLRVGLEGLVEKAALAWGSVAPTVFTCPEAEEALCGKPLSQASLREAADIVRNSVSPISDVRADADYRRAVAGNLLLRLAAVADEKKG
jgi:xanthine dehydrogenase FAD-binding subunit